MKSSSAGEPLTVALDALSIPPNFTKVIGSTPLVKFTVQYTGSNVTVGIDGALKEAGTGTLAITVVEKKRT